MMKSLSPGSRIRRMAEIPATIIQYLQEKYPLACQILLGGSYAKGLANTESDFDFIILFDEVPSVVRAVAVVDQAILDIAVHDYATLRLFMRREVAVAVCGLADDVANSVCLLPASDKCNEIIQFAKRLLVDGPPLFDPRDLKAHLLGQISDLRASNGRNSSFVLAMSIANKLLLFAIRAYGGWLGNGKYLVADLERYDRLLIQGLSTAVEHIVLNNDCSTMISFAENLIIKHTGDLSVEWKKEYIPARLK